MIYISPKLNVYAAYICVAVMITLHDHRTLANLALIAFTINVVAWVYSLGDDDREE